MIKKRYITNYPSKLPFFWSMLQVGSPVAAKDQRNPPDNWEILHRASVRLPILLQRGLTSLMLLVQMYVTRCFF